METTVRAHIRKSKGKAGSSVRSYKRKSRGGSVLGVITMFRKKTGIKTPISYDDKYNGKGTSVAYAETSFKENLEIASHKIAVDTKAAKKEGKPLSQVINHELGHILDRELVRNRKKPTDTFSKTSKGKSFLKAAYRKTKLPTGSNSYEKSNTEQFARLKEHGKI